MKTKRLHPLALALLLGSLLFACACPNKKVVTQTPAPEPPPPQPTASLSASRPEIQGGEATELKWSTQNADEISIEGLGTVAASGSRSVSPTESTTYRLLAKGPGGTADANTRVTVTAPTPPAAASEPSLNELFAKNVKDIFFDYDKYDIRAQDQQIAEANAKFFAAHPEAKLVIEGHCDERGSEEYNLALGDNRANATKALLQKLGVPSERMKVMSYGKEKPFCSDANEQCWQQNRRAHFALTD